MGVSLEKDGTNNLASVGHQKTHIPATSQYTPLKSLKDFVATVDAYESVEPPTDSYAPTGKGTSSKDEGAKGKDKGKVDKGKGAKGNADKGKGKGKATRMAKTIKKNPGHLKSTKVFSGWVASCAPVRSRSHDEPLGEQATGRFRGEIEEDWGSTS